MRIPNISHSLIDYEINPKAFINAHNFPTFKDLIEEIKRIDNDSYAFEEMLREPVFLNDFNPHEFYMTRVTTFLNHIVSQGVIQAKRRGEGMFLQNHEAYMRETAKYQGRWSFFDYCLRHRKIIQGARDISEYPRNFMRFLRRK